MALLNYDDPGFSRAVNCKIFKDCSNRTITDNGSKGIALLLNRKYNKRDLNDLFHIGLEITLALGVASAFNPQYKNVAIGGSIVLALVYTIGRFAE